MNRVRSFVKIIIDSHLYIAWAVAALVLASIPTGRHTPVLHAYILFSFLGTWMIYSIHHIIRLDVDTGGRFGQYKLVCSRPGVMLWLILCSGAASAYLVTKFLYALRWSLILPVILSILYVLPLFGKRLRDLDYLKIFLIATAWTWISSINPQILDIRHARIDWLIVLERFVFILGITIPFDIRDLEIDTKQGIKTLVSLLGVKRSKLLAILLLVLALCIHILLVSKGRVAYDHGWAFAISYILSIGLIWRAESNRSDIYFTGAIDGMMGLPWLILLISGGL